MGPNSGVTPFGQAFAFARAYTSLSGDEFSKWFPLLKAQHEDEHQHVRGVWHQASLPDGTTWAWKVNVDGGGVSQREPPPNAQLGSVFVIEPSDVRFREFVALVEKLERDGQDPSGKPLSEPSKQLLRYAVRTGDPQWPFRLTHITVGPLRQMVRDGATLAETLGRMSGETLPQLMSLRRQFGANTQTTVGLGWSMQLVGQALNCQISPQEAGRICAPLLFGEQTDPWELLAEVASALVDVGLVEILVDCADDDREAGLRAIDRALASNTIEEHFDELYGALTRTYAAWAVYRFLAGWATGDAEIRYRRVTTELDERTVRLFYPLIRQLIDLNTNAVWSLHVEHLRSAPDAATAVRSVEALTRGSLFYPTTVGRQLLLTSVDQDPKG